MEGGVVGEFRVSEAPPGGPTVLQASKALRAYRAKKRQFPKAQPGEPVAHTMGYFEPIMVYFGVQWPIISSYLAVQVEPTR